MKSLSHRVMRPWPEVDRGDHRNPSMYVGVARTCRIHPPGRICSYGVNHYRITTRLVTYYHLDSSLSMTQRGPERGQAPVSSSSLHQRRGRTLFALHPTSSRARTDRAPKAIDEADLMTASRFTRERGTSYASSLERHAYDNARLLYIPRLTSRAPPP